VYQYRPLNTDVIAAVKLIVIVSPSVPPPTVIAGDAASDTADPPRVSDKANSIVHPLVLSTGSMLTAIFASLPIG
jgi:hypothetical protein